MEISFGDKISIKAPAGSVAKFLADTEAVVSCIPDATGFKKIDERNFTMNVKIGLAFIRGDFGIKGTLAEQKGGSMAYSIEGSGIGSTVKVRLSLDMAGKGASTDVTWKADAQLGGLVSGVSENVIRKVTQDHINDIVANVKIKLEKGV